MLVRRSDFPPYYARRPRESTGRLVDVCLQCIWPSWGEVKNTLPISSGITTRQLTSCTSIFLPLIPCEADLSPSPHRLVCLYVVCQVPGYPCIVFLTSPVQCLTVVHPRDLKVFYVAKSVIVVRSTDTLRASPHPNFS